MFSIFRAAGISRRRCAAIGGLWRPQLTPTDSIRPYSTLPNRYSTTTIFPTTTQPLSNPDNHREPQPHPQPSFNRHATARQSQPRRNRFEITFQPSEAARRTIPRLANIHDSTIPHPRSLQLKNGQTSTHPQLRMQICGGPPCATRANLLSYLHAPHRVNLPSRQVILSVGILVLRERHAEEAEATVATGIYKEV